MARYQTSEEDKKSIDEWLKKGNKITVCPSGLRTSSDDVAYTHAWGKKKKKPTPKKVDSKKN